MEKYNYLEAVKNDVIEYVKSEIDVNQFCCETELEEFLQEELWACDSVTGNASGSYTFSTWEAEENLCHNLDLLAEATEDFGRNYEILRDGPEACDVIIRCYLLWQAISEAIDELNLWGA